MQSPTNDAVIEGFRAFLDDDQVLTRFIDLTARAGDASIYRLIPRVVVMPRSEEDVRRILHYCRQTGLHLTFRAAGTSLSGQAVTDGVLVDVARHWKSCRILDEGRRVAVQPGVVGAHVNAFLFPHGAKIGPDPASINACMMGGIAANNSSGMCCGVEFNTYHTMESIRLILADGYVLDTAEPGADDLLRRERPQLCAGLLDIRQRIMAQPDLVARMKAKYARKNTTGYSMNAFVDFDTPSGILSHLLIGSEGTLGFISEIRLRTLPDLPLKSTALVYFAALTDAGASIAPLVAAGAAVLEIMDRAAMQSVAADMEYGFPLEGNCAALLIEFQDSSEDALAAKLGLAMEILDSYHLLEPAVFTREPLVREHYWHMRKGLFPNVGALRETGTAVLIEDICVDPARLAECIVDLQRMFQEHGFPDSIIFGHAKDGNLHFVLCTDFGIPAQVRKYDNLMKDLMETTVRKYDGSLKAEHGTGRNVAPFVELEWGPELYALMWEVKHLADPAAILNPGVILNRDSQAHLRDLKVMPAVSPVVDKCMECGFCEPRCPSRDLTVTPRQRIALLRILASMLASHDPAVRGRAAELRASYDYDGIETCAGDSMCATACPVKIDTGAMIKDMRAAEHGPMARRLAVAAARNFGWLAASVRNGLAVIHGGGPVTRKAAELVSRIGSTLTGGALAGIPRGALLPRPAPPLPKTAPPGGENAVVYYPSCLTRMMGPIPGENPALPLADAVIAVLSMCGWKAAIPSDAGSTCCGQPFYSKGFYEALRVSAERTTEVLYDATRQGALPVVTDTSPCGGELQGYGRVLSGEHLRKWQALQIYDFPSFMARVVLPTRTEWPRAPRQSFLHPTCTLMKQGNLPDLLRVARAFSESTHVPVLAECCGFAGDKGFNTPELTRSATRPEAAELMAKARKTANPIFLSTCRTCEIGMTQATGETYRSIVYLCLEALARGENGSSYIDSNASGNLQLATASS